MSKQVTRIEEIARELLPDDSFFLVDLQIKGHPGNEKVVVLIDGDEGVDISTCSEVSRQLSAALDAQDLMEGKYILEVSSPGLDFPLKDRRQYMKNTGRQVKVLMADQSTVRGELLAVEEEGIRIRKEGKKDEKMYLPFKDIRKTNVLVSFK